MSEHAAKIRLTPPEIDRMVAGSVMGWRPYVAEWTFIGSDGAIKNTHGSARGETAFHPTADIAHAWQVVERVTDPRTPGHGGLPAGTRFLHWWSGAHLCCETAADAALKISLAALIAVGVEVEVDDA